MNIEASNIDELIQEYLDEIIENSDFNKKLSAAPKGKILEFSKTDLLVILARLRENSDDNTCKRWLEKVRRYCEINRTNLLPISFKRFGSEQKTRVTLEAMAVLMTVCAYEHNNALLYNASGTLCDIIDAKYTAKKWLDESANYLVHIILDNPSYFIGKKYEV